MYDQGLVKVSPLTACGNGANSTPLYPKTSVLFAFLVADPHTTESVR